MKTFTIIYIAVIFLAACGKSEQSATSDNTNVQSVDQTAVAAAVETPSYSAEAFFNTTNFFIASSSGYPFSPDNDEFLITGDETGVFNAYSVDVQTAERKQLTYSDTNAIFALSYFPEDERILFTSDQAGDELSHIWVREADGKTIDLTATENTKASFIGWSDSGDTFYVITNERDAKVFDLYAYKTASYERKLVYENTNALAISAISKDGNWLALSKPRTSADSNIYIVDLAKGGEPKLITEHEGNIAYYVYEFTPDSKSLIYSTNEYGEFDEAWAYDLLDGSRVEYATADWDVSFVDFSTTGRYKYVGVNADASTIVTITDMQSGKEVLLPKMGGNVRSAHFSRDDKQLAFILNSDTNPNDLYVASISTQVGTPKRLTSALSPEINQEHLVTSEVVRYKSFDGVEIPSILYKPKQAAAENPVPALVFVHGGPGGQTRRGYWAIVQHLVSHGYAVLGANNRGSSGYGKTFYHMDDKRHGEGDLQDIVMGRAYLESLDWVDSERVGIIGGSYGGYMVAAALAFEPQSFDVGINIFGVTNWVRTLKSIPPWWESRKESLYDEMGDPATDEERLRRISPLFHASNIVKPLLVIQGANDPRVLQVESDELVAAVKANGVPVEYLLFPDEGHGFVNKANTIAASNAYVKFLNTYLKNSETR